jgi:hypothetical protein
MIATVLLCPLIRHVVLTAPLGPVLYLKDELNTNRRVFGNAPRSRAILFLRVIRVDDLGLADLYLGPRNLVRMHDRAADG